MMKKLKIAPLVLALLASAAPSSAQPVVAHHGTSPLVGNWRMTSLEVESGMDQLNRLEQGQVTVEMIK